VWGQGVAAAYEPEALRAAVKAAIKGLEGD
jgi:hypothetical protein